MKTKKPDFINQTEVQKILGIKRTTFWRFRNRNKNFPEAAIKCALLWDKEAVIDFFANNKSI